MNRGPAKQSLAPWSLATMEHDDGSITGGMAVISGFLGLICVILVGHVYMLHKLTKSVAKASLD